MNGKQIGGMNLPLRLQPLGRGPKQPAMPKPIMFNPPKAAQAIREARKEIEKLLDDVAEFDDADDSTPLLDRIKQELEASQDKLDEALDNLGPFGR